MIYGGVIVTPSNTPISSPIKTIFPVTSGIIYVLKIYFPPGSAGLLHIQVFDAGYQLFPTNEGESFSGDNIDFSFDETYDKSNPPYELIALTWNDDTEYQHQLGVYMGFASRDEYIARYIPQSTVNDAIVAAMSMQQQGEEARKDTVKELIDTYGKKGK